MDKNNKFKTKFWSWFDFLTVMLFDPLLFAFFVLLVFTRLLTIVTSASLDKNIWELIRIDMEQNLGIYIGFLIVFVLWMIGKLRQHNQSVKDHRELISGIKSINENIVAMHQDIKVMHKDLSEKINNINDDNKKQN
jgi:hypothetical protein